MAPQHGISAVRLARTMALVSCATTPIALLVPPNPFAGPALLLAFAFGASAAAIMGRNLEQASFRLQLALLLSLIALPGGILPAVFFFFTWRRTSRLRSARRLAWGIRQRDAYLRHREHSRERTMARDLWMVIDLDDIRSGDTSAAAARRRTGSSRSYVEPPRHVTDGLIVSEGWVDAPEYADADVLPFSSLERRRRQTG